LTNVVVIDGAGRRDDHALAAIFTVDIGADLVAGERGDGLAGAENGAADRLVAEGRLGKAVEDGVVGRVVGGAQFLQDDVLFALQLILVEFRILQDVGQQIEGERHVVLQDADEIGCGFDAGRGVDVAADILDFLGDGARVAPCGALEGHVLEQCAMPCSVPVRCGIRP
jgi:hypothetical protein